MFTGVCALAQELNEGDIVKRAILLIMAVCCCALAGCFEWTEDPHGNLQSVGVPGLPIWKSKTPPAPMTPTEMGFTPEQASKMSVPVLVEPPTASVKVYCSHSYQSGQNKYQIHHTLLLAD